jgi:hypothetical protein
MTEGIEISRHEFGPGVLPELSTKLYRNPIAAFREVVSNAFDAMIPFEKKGIVSRIEIHTRRDGDIEIEDWGTGIEDYKNFRTISSGSKQVKDQISSYGKVNEDIIGNKGMGKLSFLNLSNENRVEFFSNNERLGMHIVMTMGGFSATYMNSQLALPHHGLKVIIKNAKHVSEARLIESLSKTFAIRLARGAKVFVNNVQIQKPEDFDSKQFKLFDLKGRIPVNGNLTNVEKPKSNNISIFVKSVFVEEKDFDYKVEGWINCDHLEPRTDRDGLYEGNELYVEFYKKLIQYLEENFEKKSQSQDKDIKSSKEITKIFINVIKSIRNLYPEMTIPRMSGNLSREQGIGSLSNVQDDTTGACALQEGYIVDPTKRAETRIAKPVGEGKGHRHGTQESISRIIQGDGRILAPSSVLFSGKDIIPELKVVVLESEGKHVVYFSAPDRIVINSIRPSSQILKNASPKDPEMESRVLPLLVIAGIDAFSGSSEISKEEWLKMYHLVLDSAWSMK